MRHFSEFIAVSAELFRPGQSVAVNLHIFMPLNKTIVFFRRVGDQLSPEDCAKIASLPKGTLLVHRSERDALFSPLAQDLAEQLRQGGLSAPGIRENASEFLKSIDSEAAPGGTASGEVARELLNEVPKLVETVMEGLEKTPSVQSYEAILRNARSAGENPILTHNQQVSAIAILMRLTVGPDPILGSAADSHEDLASLGAAGLMHDLGLLELPRSLIEKHLIGDDEFTVSEKITYMKHIERSLDLIAKTKVPVTEETLLTINQHHENFDGTGFRGIDGKVISYPARILRIADDIVACINHPANTFGFRQALGHLSWKERQAGGVLYDPDLMNSLAELK